MVLHEICLELNVELVEYDDKRRGMEIIGANVADSCPVVRGTRGSPVLQGGGKSLQN